MPRSAYIARTYPATYSTHGQIGLFFIHACQFFPHHRHHLVSVESTISTSVRVWSSHSTLSLSLCVCVCVCVCVRVCVRVYVCEDFEDGWMLFRTAPCATAPLCACCPPPTTGKKTCEEPDGPCAHSHAYMMHTCSRDCFRTLDSKKKVCTHTTSLFLPYLSHSNHSNLLALSLSMARAASFEEVIHACTLDLTVSLSLSPSLSSSHKSHELLESSIPAPLVIMYTAHTLLSPPFSPQRACQRPPCHSADCLQQLYPPSSSLLFFFLSFLCPSRTRLFLTACRTRTPNNALNKIPHQ